MLLVALRCWAGAWRHERVSLEVRADSVASLTMAMSMKASGPGPSLVARELALVLGTAEFKPGLCSHIPGVANVTADVLSRLHEPGKSASLPAALIGVQQTFPPKRDRSYYLTLRSGVSPQSKAEKEGEHGRISVREGGAPKLKTR